MSVEIKAHSPFKTQYFVIKALLRREMLTRFGKYKLGVLWMVIDPLISVIILGVVLGPFIGRSSGDIPYAFFLLCGYMFLGLVTGPLNACTNAISSNQGLLVFRQVQPIDVFYTRFIYELLSTTVAFAFFCIISMWMGVNLSLNNIFTLFNCILITWAMGCGLGLTVSIASMKISELEKVVGYIQRPLIFVSAVLYPVSAIPPEFRSILLLNPIVHTIEISRFCLFPSHDIQQVNLIYPAMFALVSVAFGFMSYRNNRHFLTQR